MISFVIAIGVIVLGLVAMIVLLLVWIGRINRYRDDTQADLNLRELKLSEKEQEFRDWLTEYAHFARWASELYTPDPMPEPKPDSDDTIQR